MEETVYSLLGKIEAECCLVKNACVLNKLSLEQSFNRIENYIEEARSLINEEISLKED